MICEPKFGKSFGDGGSSTEPNVGEGVTSTATNEYAAAGTYTVTMTVRSSANANKVCRVQGNVPSVTVVVDPAVGNTPPTANDDVDTTDQDVPVNIDVLANDTDPDVGDILSVDSVTQGTNGSVTNNNGTDVTYTPSGGFLSLIHI